MSSIFGPFKSKLSLRYGERREYGNEKTKEELGSLIIELRHPSHGYTIDFSVTNEEIERRENGERYKTGIVYSCGDPSGEIPNAQIGKPATKSSLTRFIRSSRLLGECAKTDDFYMELKRGNAWEEITVPQLSSRLTKKAQNLYTPLINISKKLRYTAGAALLGITLTILGYALIDSKIDEKRDEKLDKALYLLEEVEQDLEGRDLKEFRWTKEDIGIKPLREGRHEKVGEDIKEEIEEKRYIPGYSQ
jgi:hypothetical protein